MTVEKPNSDFLHLLWHNVQIWKHVSCAIDDESQDSHVSCV